MTADDSNETTVEGYDALAAHPDDIPWGTGVYQRHYVWPAVRPLVPDVERARLLDAGCGVGDYTERFLDDGATVVGVDASAEALAVARDRFGDRAEFLHANLTAPLALADDSFDVVFCNLVLDHIEDWDPVLSEFRRALVPDGHLVFTTIHPMRRFRRYRDELGTYYDTAGYVGYWGDPQVPIVSNHRPIAEIDHAMTDNGFDVDVFREAQPPAEFEECHPDRYERAMEEPDLLCVRADVSLRE